MHKMHAYIWGGQGYSSFYNQTEVNIINQPCISLKFTKEGYAP